MNPIPSRLCPRPPSNWHSLQLVESGQNFVLGEEEIEINYQTNKKKTIENLLN